MKNLKRSLAAFAIAFAVAASIAGSFALATPTATAGIRYCCTPQQVAACQAQGGTTSCRTDLCRCFH